MTISKSATSEVFRTPVTNWLCFFESVFPLFQGDPCHAPGVHSAKWLCLCVYPAHLRRRRAKTLPPIISCVFKGLSCATLAV
jgi:hypothetical protein